MELKFTLKDSKEKQTLLYAVCYHESKRIKVSTGLKVVSEAWNAKMQRCEISSRFTERVNRASRKVNKLLDTIIEKWKWETEQGNMLWRQSKYHSREEIIKGDLALIISKVMNVDEKEEEKKQITPLEFFDKYVEEMTHKVDQRTGRYIGERTQVHHRTVLARIKAFMAEKYIKDDFSVFDERFARLFTDWAYTSKNYRQNTIPATFSILKVWLDAARAEKLFDGKFPKLTDKANTNRHLQEIGRHARIDDEIMVKENRGGKIISHIYKKYQMIKMHTARRSFATNLYLDGAPTISIMKLTGHTTEMNFLKYIKITKEENAEMMRKFFK